MSATRTFNAKAFYAALSRVVETRGVSWNRVGQDTGIAPSSLSRLGRGRDIQGAALAKLSAWAGINPAEFVEDASNQEVPVRLIGQILESDPRLDARSREALVSIVKSAYQSLVTGSVLDVAAMKPAPLPRVYPDGESRKADVPHVDETPRTPPSSSRRRASAS